MMNKMMNCLHKLVACALAIVGSAWGLTVEALPTHGVFYAGVEAQPCLRLKVTAEAGEKLSRVVCSTKGSGKGCIGAAYLYRSQEPFFSLHAEGEAGAEKLAKANASADQLNFKLNGAPLKEGVHYFWLVYDVPASAKGGEKVGGTLLSAADGAGKVVKPAKGKDGSCRADGKTPATPGEVYPFKYRIAPYVRPKWALRHNKEMWTAAHLKNMTDFIVFGYTHSGSALVPAHDAQAGEHDYSDECLALARRLRGNGRARILAGFTCNENKNPMAGVLHDAEKRRELARNMAALVLEKGYEGIDIDWEYPRENGRFKPFASWRKFAVFLAELREELAGTGASISIAVTTRYDAPNIEVLDGADFINSMSYGRPSEHSTKEAAKEDVAFLLKRRIPPVKVVLGLPFFSRDIKPKHADKGGCGYSSIVKWFPNLPAGRNKFKHPEDGAMHFFNGADLIKDKCRTFVLQQGIGGVCIWAYDTDVPISHAKSLSKAMYSVLKQTGR